MGILSIHVACCWECTIMAISYLLYSWDRRRGISSLEGIRVELGLGLIILRLGIAARGLQDMYVQECVG
jgi:hypothetical protein